MLLLLSNPESAALLADMLTRSRTVLLADGDGALDRRFDLAIVDGPVLQRLWRRIVERKRVAAPASLPFLLVTTPADTGLFARFVWTAVDEVIQAPVQAPELLARVDVLLRARGASRQPDRAERRYWLSQRLEAAGKLAAGIAHHYNNMLGTILGYSDLLLADLPLGDPRRDDVEAIRTAALKSAELTRQLLAFSRQQVLNPVALELNDVIAGMERAIRSLIGEGIVGSFKLEPGLPAVAADRGQIEQVLLNLVLNAREAMSGGGELTVVTSRLHLAEPDRSHEGVEIPAGTYAVLSVSDTGVGMDADTRASAFEPFFTTKPQGLGAGLGLPTAYGIVKQSGGFIWLESERGKGTTVRVYLPEGQAPVPATAAPASSNAPAQPRGEVVLLVEDDDSLRVMAARILRQRGYAVLEANHGAAALGVLGEHAGRLDILVTDVVMPEMDGIELAHEVTRFRPETRVLFMSGYAQRDLFSGATTPGATLLQKPFRIGELVGAIRKVLDAEPGAVLNPASSTDAA